VHSAADTVADQAADDGEALLLGRGLDRVRDVRQPVSRPALRDARGERPLASLEQVLRVGRDLADRERVGRVGDEAVERDPTSTERMSPSASAYGRGIPCTTMSFGEVQIEAG
jgi:hypothetical protein